MDYLKFKSCVDIIIDCHTRSRKAYSSGINLLEYDDQYYKLANLLWSEILTEEGVDWLEWYLYEKDGVSGNPRHDINAWDGDKNPICWDIESLHDYLIRNKFFIKIDAKL